MRSAGPKPLFLIVLLWGILIAFGAFAVEKTPGAAQFQSEFNGIKTRLANVEKTQKDILSQKDKIIEEIDRVRVWVRHSGGNP